MKKNNNKWIFTILTTSIMFLVSCNNAPSQKQDTLAQPNSPSVSSETTGNGSDNSGSGILNLRLSGEVDSLDPHVTSDGIALTVISTFTEGLFRRDQNGAVIPSLVERSEESSDGLTYTYTLKDARWSSGASVTADDFVFAWRKLIDPANAYTYSFIPSTAAIVNAEEILKGEKPPAELGVAALDDKTLQITLSRSVPYFEALLAMPAMSPINEEFYTAQGSNYGISPQTTNANGPFRLTSYQPAATTIVLEKNPEYYDKDRVSLSGIKYQVIKDSQQSLLAYQNGDLDIAALSGEQAELFQNDPEYRPVLSGFLWFISPNLNTPGLENVNLRNALARAFDKETLVNTILKDGSVSADFLVSKLTAAGPDNKDFRDTTGTYLHSDKELALEYWNKAKEELGVSELTYTILVEDEESAINTVQFIQAQIQETLPGIRLVIEQMPKKNRVERMTAGDYELGLTRWSADYPDPTAYLDLWTTGNPYNYGSWSDSEYDALLEEVTAGKLINDKTARWETLKEIEKIAAEQAAIFPVYQKGDAVLVKQNLENVQFRTGGVLIPTYIKKN